MLRSRLLPGLCLVHNICSMTNDFKSPSNLKQIVNCYNKPLVYFPIDGNKVEILHSPESFFLKLKQFIDSSQRRITLASLYLGSGRLEKELVKQLDQRLDGNKDLKVTIVLDYNRGQRLNDRGDSKSSSKGILQPLADKADVAFFLSPVFATILNRSIILPWPVVNEIISLQHIKCYLFDDKLIISGANLSEQYFTNRQDRYICIHDCPKLCDYLEKILTLVAKCSLKLSKDGQLELHQGWKYHPLDKKNQTNFIDTFRKEFSQIQAEYNGFEVSKEQEETIIIPMLQMNCFNVTEDSEFTRAMLKHHTSSSSSETHLVSGYFNLTQEYIDILTANGQLGPPLKVLMASEEVNGFYGAKGFKGYIPSIYTDRALKFLSYVQRRAANIQLYSYIRDGWTFHAKGIWMKPHASDYFLTSVGSSNFGYRSVERDLELQFVLATRNTSLTSNLELECSHLWKFAKPIKDVKDLPKVPLMAEVISKVYGDYF